MLITCSFKEAPQYEGEKYSIANSQPEPRLYIIKKHLAPSWNLVCGFKSKYITEEDFSVRYIIHLDNLGPYAIADLERDVHHAAADDRNIIYLCWEPYGEFCHRHILIDWMLEKFKFSKKMVVRR